MSAQRTHLDLYDRFTRWRERYKRPIWTARALRHSGAADANKKGIENHERKQRAHLDLNYPALHDGESGTNVQCGRREHSGGGSLTPKRASRTMSAP